MSNLGRQPMTLVEIDMPHCTRRFGVAPCTATLSASVPCKCFNTRATCADLANYVAGTKTLTFGKNQTGLPSGLTVFPILQSVSSSPMQINLSGIDPSSNALGRRDRVTVSLKDIPYHDTYTDPYAAERKTGAAQYSGIGYDPAENGTLIANMLARHPYFVGDALRVKRGYVGDDPASMETSHSFITEWSGPNADGGADVTAKDIFDLAENSKAVAPRPSNGKLAAAITSTDVTATLKPAGIGDAEYASSGRICIGREVMMFTRSADVLTLTARGMDGTVAASHAVNDVAQQCLRYSGIRSSEAITDLMVSYAGASAGVIDVAEWTAEDDSWMGGLRLERTITKPTGVKQLIGEICQLGVMVWWDKWAGQLRFRCNRPLSPGEAYFPVTDAANILHGSVSVERAEAQRISALFFWHGLIDPTDGTDNARNYDKLALVVPEENLYRQESIKTIFCPWFGQFGNDAAATAIAERLLARYVTTPKRISLTLDIKDRDNVDLGGLLLVNTHSLRTPTGQIDPQPMQINMMERIDDRIKIEAETYTIDGRFGFLMQDPAPDYDTATDLEKAEGCFLMDDSIGVFPDGSGPYVMF